jgi:hypothetical protein
MTYFRIFLYIPFFINSIQHVDQAFDVYFRFLYRQLKNQHYQHFLLFLTIESTFDSGSNVERKTKLFPVCFCILKVFFKKIKFFLFFSLLQINIFLMFSNYFIVLISKIIFKK